MFSSLKVALLQLPVAL